MLEVSLKYYYRFKISILIETLLTSLAVRISQRLIFLYGNMKKTKLWAIQITVGKNPGIHVDKWISSEACKDSLNALQTETNQPTTQKIWIIATDPSKLWDGQVFCRIIGEDFVR